MKKSSKKSGEEKWRLKKSEEAKRNAEEGVTSAEIRRKATSGSSPRHRLCMHALPRHYPHSYYHFPVSIVHCCHFHCLSLEREREGLLLVLNLLRGLFS